MNQPIPESQLADVAVALGLGSADLRRVADRLDENGTATPTIGEAYAMLKINKRITTAQQQSWGSKLSEFVQSHSDVLVGSFTLADAQLHCKTTATAGLARSQSYAYHYERARAAIRFFFVVLLDANVLSVSPVERLKSVARPDSKRRPLSSSELSDIWSYVRTKSSDPELDLLFLRAQRETGSRCGGILTLTIARLDPDDLSVVILGKNGRNPRLPISTALATDLLRHAQCRGVDLNDNSQVILRYKNGNPVTSRRLDTLFAGLRAHYPWAARIGLSSHFIRYTTLKDIEILFGSHVAAAYAGHRKDRPQAIDTYTAVTFDELRDAHTALFGKPVPDLQLTWDQEVRRNA